jgi:hypothetical protein
VLLSNSVIGTSQQAYEKIDWGYSIPNPPVARCLPQTHVSV